MGRVRGSLSCNMMAYLSKSGLQTSEYQSWNLARECPVLTLWYHPR